MIVLQVFDIIVLVILGVVGLQLAVGKGQLVAGPDKAPASSRVRVTAGILLAIVGWTSALFVGATV